VDVAELWELVHEEDDPLPLADLAELAFGRPVNGDQLSATLRALFEDRRYFRLAGNEFLPLTAKQLEQKEAQLAVEARHQAEVEAAVAFLRDFKAGRTQDPAPERLVRLLSDLVILEDDAPEVKTAKEIVSQAELGGRRKVFKLLVRLGVFEPHEDLAIRREGLPAEFPPEVQEAARDISLEAALDQGREDLTGLYTFTIDGAFTTDFDDALSFEPFDQGGGELGVHITDAAALLPPEHVVTLDARERASSLYLPDRRVPMLPPSLSEDLLSLRQDELRPAISCLARLDQEGRILDWRVTRGLIRVDRRLTYDESDQLLEDDPRLQGLKQACLELKKRRALEGAYFLPLPEVLVGVDEQGQVWVHRVDEEGPSRQMVAETAILANRLFAQYLMENQVPALFRTQAQPGQPIENGEPSDLYLHFKQRRLLNRVEITTCPGLHSSLGAEPYTHATSPIRRYLDLLMQHQLGSSLSGREPVYSEEDLTALAMQVEPNVRRGLKVRQARKRYWLLVWLSEQIGQPQEALVMEKQTHRWQLLLTQTMLLVNIPLKAGEGLVPGQTVELRLERVDPFEDVLRVSLI
jgi:exoribonuclease-2